MLKIVGAVLVALPVVGFFVWAYREMGLTYFLSFVKGLLIGALCWASIIVGLGLLGAVKN